ncbi:hypothetical protein [Sphaerotilus sp.]|uniref:hypothetical protein n=1 Tax=Sphaerotilus sp. TaxID=2093942 RepID=UPI002ACE4C98|nr:hypothetical protein [Sphaerotilus sp.]MDZ7855246.1 hypothetical protein [Sphaerotilus sp.]
MKTMQTNRAGLPATMKTLATAAALVALAGCGGGGSDSTTGGTTTLGPLTLSGVVAARAVATGNSVDVKCASGTGTATSNADGSYTVTVTDGQLPCVLRAKGTTDGDLYSVATGTGRTATANLTPLTQLVVASMAGGAPATFYDNFGADMGALVTPARAEAALGTVQTDLTARGINTAGIGNPITAPLVPVGTSQTANPYGEVLAGLEAGLTTGGTTLAQLVTAVAKASPTVRLPAELLSQPQASNCSAVRSGALRFVWIAPAELKADGDFGTVSRITLDAQTMTFSNANGSTTSVTANGTCRYKGSTGLNGGPAEVVVSQGGVMLVSSTISGVKRLGIGFPEQSLADLAGEYNMMQVESSQGVVAGNGVTFRLNVSGAIESGSCQPGEVLARTCTPFAGPLPKLSVNTAGGFTMTSTDPADPWTDRWFAYRTGSGDVMLMWIGQGGTFGFASPKVARTLPSLGTSRSWGASMDMASAASATTFGETTYRTKSVDAATDSYVRTIRNPLLATDDSHDQTIQHNWPRTGWTHLAAGSSPTPSGTLVSFREWVNLRLLGTGLSVTYSVPTATQSPVFSFTVTQ